MKFFRKSSETWPDSLAEPDSFARFYEQTHLSVFRYVMVLCAGDQAEAEDITAEAYLRAWQKRQQFTGSAGAALGWAIAIARNLLIDRRRVEKNQPLAVEAGESLTDLSAPLEDFLIDKEQLQRVLSAIQELPFQQGNIVSLRYVLGWRVNEIAAHLGLAENTVSVELRRALARLQSHLALPEPLSSGG